MVEAKLPPVASLSSEAVAKVQALEEKLGHVVIVAYEQPFVPAQMTQEQLDALWTLEKELGVCLIAYRKNNPPIEIEG